MTDERNQLPNIHFHKFWNKPPLPQDIFALNKQYFLLIFDPLCEFGIFSINNITLIITQ